MPSVTPQVARANSGRVALIGAASSIGIRPYDAGDQPRHLDRAPAALRQAGLNAALQAEDLGDLRPPPYRDFVRPPGRVRNEDELIAYTRALADVVGRCVIDGRFVVLLGGDCSIVLGALLGAKQIGPVGLAYVDGHADFATPQESQTGSAASMCLAMAVGRGDSRLSRLAAEGPLVQGNDVALIGRRDHGQAYGHDGLAVAGVLDIDRGMLARTGAGDAVARILERLATPALHGFWIHVDADVLDAEVMPAVDSPEPDGLSIEELVEIIGPLVRHPRALGMQLTIYDPALDVDGSCAERMSSLLATVVSARGTA
jgi:arginase